jgi:hypothetical protein
MKLLVIPWALLAVLTFVQSAPADLREWKKMQFEVVGEEVPVAQSMDELRSLFTDPLVCSGCHPQHHAAWSRSYHAKSIENAGFQTLFQRYLDFLASEETKKELGRETTAEDLRQCLFCHAPQVQFASDDLVTRLSDAIAAGRWEETRGAQISCVVCHAITPEGTWASASFRENDTFFGPLRDPVPQAMHKSQFSELHTRSEFCAKCHSLQRFNVFCSLVYDQQQQVAAEKRGNCQDCHMKGTENVRVALGGKKDRILHDHTFPGGRFLGMWEEALDLELLAERKEPGELVVTVTLRSKVPHNVPDG